MPKSLQYAGTNLKSCNKRVNNSIGVSIVRSSHGNHALEPSPDTRPLSNQNKLSPLNMDILQANFDKALPRTISQFRDQRVLKLDRLITYDCKHLHRGRPGSVLHLSWYFSGFSSDRSYRLATRQQLLLQEVSMVDFGRS